MKNLALLLTVCSCLSGCGKPKAPVKKLDPSEILKKQFSEMGHVDFRSWNGNLRGLDSDDVLHFYKDSKVELEDIGYSLLYYKGSYQLRPEGRVAISLSGYGRDWPIMALRREGEDLLLYREDGHTSWLPKGDSNLPCPDVDGFWPFRAR